MICKTISPEPSVDESVNLQQTETVNLQLRKLAAETLIPGEDYGLIPGYSKPTLLKPGAEKLCVIFGFAIHASILHQVEECKKGLFAYTVKVTLVNKQTGIIAAEGLGSCNNREGRYRLENPFTNANTILKMAKKRALVDAVLSATSISGLYTQDIEYLPSQPSSSPSKGKPLDELFRHVKRLAIASEDARTMMAKRYGVEDSRMLTTEQVEDFIAFLQNTQPSS